ncbi:hypothetical protein EHM76_06685 [bacterium]|nr:MAG: hypothetical protein EHM76_06685 [bacterium]
MTTIRKMEAMSIWDWIQWRLPPEVWLAAQDVLHGTAMPTPTDPQLAAGLAELVNPTTTNTRKLTLIRQLLNILKNG